MKRKDFLRYSLAGTGAALILPGSIVSCAGRKKQVPLPSWTWYVAGKNKEHLKKDLRKLKRYGFEGVHIQGNDEAMAEAVMVAGETGLKIHRWVITLMNRDKQIIEGHPDWFVVSREGKSSVSHPPYVPYYKWLCPNHEGVISYLEEKIAKMASLDGLAGIHLDYIRFPDVILPRGLWKKYNIIQDREYPQYDFCYCDVCRGKFASEHGVDPLDLPDPAADPAWRQFRLDSITRLVERLAAVVRKHGKKISAAVFPTPSIAEKLVRQQWDRWELDAVFPMMYHNFYEKEINWLEEAVREGEEALQGRFPLYAGVFISAIAAQEMPEAVRYVAKGNAQGICLFRYGSMNKEHWKYFLV